MASSTFRLIQGGLVVWPERVGRADLLLAGERIVALLAPDETPQMVGTAQVERVHAAGLLVLPGLIDTHVHFTTGTKHVDSLPQAAAGGALGGLTTLLGHVRSLDNDIVGEIARQRALVADCPIDVAFHAIIDPTDDVEQVIPALAAAGIRSFKFFMAYRREGTGMDDAQLLASFKQVAKVGGVALVHAEDDAAIQNIERDLAAAGRTDITDYPASRPAITEVEAIHRALHLAEMAGNALYIVHCSTAEGLCLLLKEKQRHLLGQRPPVYVESCPQYLLLEESVYRTLGGIAKIAPPIRPESERATLYQALLAGIFDGLGSDHSPHPLSSKQGADFTQMRAGGPGVQSLVPVLLSALLAEDATNAGGTQAIRQLARCMSRNPAQIFGLSPNKGEIAVGAHADLLLVDPASEWQIDPAWLISNSGFSVFAGRQLQGRVVHSLVRNRWVLRERELVAQGGGIAL